MAFLAGAAMFPELILSAEEGLGSIVTGLTTEFASKAKQTIASNIGSELANIASSNPSGLTNMTLNEVIKKKNHAISHPRKSGRKRKHI